MARNFAQYYPDLLNSADGLQQPSYWGGGGGSAYFVAANDASDEEKSAADYTCDGTNDEVQIQAAIDALPALGGKVVLSHGTFSVSAGIEIIGHSIQLHGQGVDATNIVSTAATFNIIQMGDRQNDSVMRNWMGLFDMTVTHAGGASDYACVVMDGGGRGSTIQRVQTNEGKYGFQLIDIDRCWFASIDANNPRTAGIICQVGLEGTWGTVMFIDPSMALSDNDSVCWIWDKTAGGSSNRFDRIGIYNALFFSTTGVTGTIGLQMNIGASAMVIQNSLFESPTLHHVHLVDTCSINFTACSMIQNASLPTKTTNGFYLETDNHKITVDTCRFQQMTNLFNGASGFSQLMFQGLSENQGNIDNIFTGSFGARFGTDVLFAGDDELVMGGDNERYNKVQSSAYIFKENGSAPSTATGKAALFVNTSNQLIYKDEAGTEYTVDVTAV